MVDISRKIDLLQRLGIYMLSNDEGWETAKQWAQSKNAWFTKATIEMAVANIVHTMLNNTLPAWVAAYKTTTTPKKVGIVMAGNIPLVGFHDFLCCFLSGHKSLIKLSGKDEVLLKHLVEQLIIWEPKLADELVIAERLNNCDAYIATGSNNTSRYFEAYFGKYPNIIRKNRTSVAVLDGSETKAEMELLGDDVFQFYGMGCRNVSQIYVPEAYNFTPLFQAFEKHQDIINHNKYKNNFDYNLALLLLNKVHYLTDNVVLLTESSSVFSPLSVLNYMYYTDKNSVLTALKNNNDIQCIIGHDGLAFGSAQCPGLSDYADGVDTMQFLCGL